MGSIPKCRINCGTQDYILTELEKENPLSYKGSKRIILDRKRRRNFWKAENEGFFRILIFSGKKGGFCDGTPN